MSRKRKGEMSEGGVEAAVESKHDRFVRLANRRVGRALNVVGLVGNLSARSAYEYSEGEADAIINGLFKALEAMAFRFRNQAKPKAVWDLLSQLEP